MARVGLVATNSIREKHKPPGHAQDRGDPRIFEAWNEEKWTVDGAMVDVSLICFGDNGGGTCHG